jgi:AcrR family transcriptional regulator
MERNAETSGVEAYRHGRVPRAVRERQILDLAEELFAERGYEGASMDELARRAGVTKPVIYDLVGSKEGLFHRVFQRSGDELAERVAEAVESAHGDFVEELRASTLAFLQFVDEHERAWAMLFSLDTGGRTAAAVEAIRARQARFVADRLLGLAKEQGATLDPRRAEAIAFALNGAYESLAHWRRTNPGTSSEELATWLVEFARPGLASLISP